MRFHRDFFHTERVNLPFVIFIVFGKYKARDTSVMSLVVDIQWINTPVTGVRGIVDDQFLIIPELMENKNDINFPLVLDFL
jgi:hypothetical protein